MDQNKNCLIVLPFDIFAKKIAEIKKRLIFVWFQMLLTTIVNRSNLIYI